MTERTPFNVNEYVWVKLTEAGRAELTRQHFELQRWIESRNPHANIEPYYEPRGDDGWRRFQLWDLMYRLGPLCYMGGKVPFETTIEFEKPHEMSE